MLSLTDISSLWQKRANEPQQTGLIATFKQLVAMRKYVPYLQGKKLTNSSVQTGNIKSSFKGRGMEFEEVRAYNYGDDIRDIDWRVTARKNQPYTKLYATEKDREVFVWIDMSKIMRFGTRKELKSVTAAKTAALLGWFTLENKDRFGLALFDGNKTHIFDSKRSYDNLLAVFKKIENISEQTLHDENDTKLPEKSLQTLQKKLHHRSILFLIGTFNDMSESLKRNISNLAHYNEMYLINIYDMLEEKSPPTGVYMTEYDQEKQLLISNGNDFAKLYAAYFSQKRKKTKDFCAKFNCHYREIRTDLPIYFQISPL